MSPSPPSTVRPGSAEGTRDDLSRREPPRTRQSGHRLLIVDDEDAVLESLQHLFHRGYHVLTAHDGPTALALLQEHEVHVILSDQRMPGMTGDAFLARARLLVPDAIRMLFTGYADIQAVIGAVNEGQIFRYIHKPWDAAELEAIVSQAAQQYDLLADRRRLIDELRGTNDQLTRANRELADSVRLKTAFLEVASHEFNTPITIVKGLGDLLRLINPDREPSEREILDQIAAGSDHLARLVASTLKMLGADDLRNPLRRAPVDLTALLNELAGHITPFIHARRQCLRVEVFEGLGCFEIDADKVRDAVLNLLTNAIKFTPDGGEIALEACLTGPDLAEIRVIDRGIGVGPRELAHFFEPFFTEFDSSRHSSGDFGFNRRGLGLGLSLVKKFTELHGGRVEARSEPGLGTQITLSLPRREFPTDRSAVESP